MGPLQRPMRIRQGRPAEERGIKQRLLQLLRPRRRLRPSQRLRQKLQQDLQQNLHIRPCPPCPA
jgi:hypothetical protein